MSVCELAWMDACMYVMYIIDSHVHDGQHPLGFPRALWPPSPVLYKKGGNPSPKEEVIDEQADRPCDSCRVERALDIAQP